MTETLLEAIPCVCGGKQYRTVVSRHPRGWQIACCVRCSLHRTVPVPPPGGTQPPTEESKYVEQQIRARSQWEGFARYVLMEIRRYQQKGRLLDIGCSIGVLVEEAARWGFDAYGVEPNPAAARYAQERGLKVYTGLLQDVVLPEGSFEVAVLNHVLEHVHEPVPLLKTIHRLLVPEGLLFVGVPNFGSPFARYFSERWFYLDPEEHVWQFTPQTLSIVLRRGGFEPLRVHVDLLVHGYPPTWKGVLKRLVFAGMRLVGKGDSLVVLATKAGSPRR